MSMIFKIKDSWDGRLQGIEIIDLIIDNDFTNTLI
jgi:hypothetical protein